MVNEPATPTSCEIPPELVELYRLGKDRKLWTLTIVFDVHTETMQIIHRNLRNEEVIKMRQNIFQIGFLHPVTEGSWRVVNPLDIVEVLLDQQDHFFAG